MGVFLFERVMEGDPNGSRCLYYYMNENTLDRGVEF
jgi:hypothetical protein